MLADELLPQTGESVPTVVEYLGGGDAELAHSLLARSCALHDRGRTVDRVDGPMRTSVEGQAVDVAEEPCGFFVVLLHGIVPF